jgi:hypothetical protein
MVREVQYPVISSPELPVTGNRDGAGNHLKISLNQEEFG